MDFMSFLWPFVIGVLTGGGWGLVAGLRNARDIALQQPAQPLGVPRIGATRDQGSAR